MRRLTSVPRVARAVCAALVIVLSWPLPPLAGAHTVRYGERTVKAARVVPKVRDGKVYYPIRFVAEALGWEVRWVHHAWEDRTVAVNRDLAAIERRLRNRYEHTSRQSELVVGYDFAAGYQYTAERGFERLCGPTAVWNPTPAPGDEDVCWEFPAPPVDSSWLCTQRQCLVVDVDAVGRLLYPGKGEAFLEGGRVWVEEALLEELLDVSIEP